MCVILQFTSTIILRTYQPRLQRGYRIPIESNFWYFVILLPTFAVQIIYAIYAIVSQFNTSTAGEANPSMFFVALKRILIIAPVCFFIVQLVFEIIKGDYGRDEYLEDAIATSASIGEDLLKLYPDNVEGPLLDGKDGNSSEEKVEFGDL